MHVVHLMRKIVWLGDFIFRNRVRREICSKAVQGPLASNVKAACNINFDLTSTVEYT